MKEVEIKELSKKYNVRRLNHDDVEMIYLFCRANTQYYEYCEKEPSIELIENDLTITPPGISLQQKYYIGFFDHESLVAVMDLIMGYPDEDSAFIGFFMMNKNLQGRGFGSNIVNGVLERLKEKGIVRCQLGIDKDNPQSNHFWRKNGFKIIREVEQEQGAILVAEKRW